MRKHEKFLQYYKSVALILLNVFISLVFFNAVFFVGFKIKDHFFSVKNDNPITKIYDISTLKKVYPQWDKDEILGLLHETYSRPYIYEPFTQFKERPFKGKYVNVDENGFRVIKDQGPWPPVSENFNIFLFGGSTIFGNGVSDEQTVASYLQQILSNKLNRDVRVYNFGRRAYYSSQELILLERLLVKGTVPDVAIFIDGLNEFFFFDDKPTLTTSLTQYVNGTTQEAKSDFLNNLPMFRVARFARNQISRYLDDSNLVNEKSENPSYDNEVSISIVKRYIENKKIIEAISTAYGVQPIFVWQPVPTYKYDLSYHLFGNADTLKESWLFKLKYGYTYMGKLYREKQLGDNFFWCADIQEHLQEPLYVDGVHYTAKMSQMLANCIAMQKLEKFF